MVSLGCGFGSIDNMTKTPVFFPGIHWIHGKEMAWRHGKGIYPGREFYWRKGVEVQEDQQLAGIKEPEGRGSQPGKGETTPHICSSGVPMPEDDCL